ncbi:hypothetical protein FRB93_010319 [Tulasnella sp. JGI-2019a]|nr:hypothetical protein FRB93_010319 [Tulasnella sp. JGI-2019a]
MVAGPPLAPTLLPSPFTYRFGSTPAPHYPSTPTRSFLPDSFEGIQPPNWSTIADVASMGDQTHPVVPVQGMFHSSNVPAGALLSQNVVGAELELAGSRRENEEGF